MPYEKPPGGVVRPGITPMSPDDPRRLKPGQSLLTFVAPAPAGHDADPAGHDAAPPRQPAGETSAKRPNYTWILHFDYGLLRDGGDGYDYDYEHFIDGIWHTITGPEILNGSIVDENVAKEIIVREGGKVSQLYDRQNNARYARETRAVY
jgi:hypothetical protein